MPDSHSSSSVIAPASAEERDAICLANQRNSPLLRLPAEIRNVVYQHVCDTLIYDADFEILHWKSSNSGLALLSVCRQVSSEASKFINKDYISPLGPKLSTTRQTSDPRPSKGNIKVLQLPPLAYLYLCVMLREMYPHGYTRHRRTIVRFLAAFPDVQILEVYAGTWDQSQLSSLKSLWSWKTYSPNGESFTQITILRKAFHNEDLKVVFPKNV